jgi:hypothetical protein
MKEILCNIDMFTMGQTVYSIDTERTRVAIEIGESDITHLPEALHAACQEYGANKIHLFGEENYTNLVAEDIKVYYSIKHSNEFVEIEVN